MAPNEKDPINLLALDGGGIRGVSELIILDRIMKRIQEKEGLAELPKPCDYFHIIGGTSTGGLVAILLGRLRMSTTEALQEYDNFAKKIFSSSNRRVYGVSARFNAEPIIEAVQTVVERRGESELMRKPKEELMGRAFVCAMPAHDQEAPLRFRSYSSSDDWDDGVTIWEAARATTAAPSFFKPITIKCRGTEQQFIDAAMGVNNPAAEVLDEAGMLLDYTRKIGCILSLGTGTRKKTLMSGIGWTLKMGALMKDITTDSERVHRDLSKRFVNFPSTYFRFSVPEAAKEIPMANYKKMGKLKEMTEKYLDTTAKWDMEMIVDTLSENRTEGLTVGDACFPVIERFNLDLRRSLLHEHESGFFVGRKRILKVMSDYLLGAADGTTQLRGREFLLWGVGGVGKSQIALRFSGENKKKFAFCFRVDATSLYSLQEGYMKIGKRLWADAADTTEPESQKLLIRVMDWMNSFGKDWLLILDNISHDGPWISYLPKRRHSHIIYTSRQKCAKPDLPEDAIEEVKGISKKEAATLLLSVASRPLDHPFLQKQAVPIVRALGCLPLAIVQAGAFMYHVKTSLGKYLHDLRVEKESRMANPVYRGLTPSDQAIYTTLDSLYTQLLFWANTWGRYGKGLQAQAAMKILNTICFYSHENISTDIFRQAAECRPSRDDDDPLMNEALSLRIGEYSLEELVRVDPANHWVPNLFQDGVRLLVSLFLLIPHRLHGKGGSYSMHVSVHGWARNRLSDKEKEAYSLLAQRLLAFSIGPFNKTASRNQYIRNVTHHFKACYELIPGKDSSLDLLSLTLGRSRFLRKLGGDWRVEEQDWKYMIREAQLTSYPGFDDDLPDSFVFQFRWRLACLYMDLGRFQEAECLFVEMLERMKFYPDPESNGDAHLSVLQMMGTLYWATGRLEELILLFEEMRKERRKRGSPEDLKVIQQIDSKIQELRTKLDSASHWSVEESARQKADPQRAIRVIRYYMAFGIPPEDDDGANSEFANEDRARSGTLKQELPKETSISASLSEEESELFDAYHRIGDYSKPDDWDVCVKLTDLVRYMVSSGRPQCAAIIAKDIYKRHRDCLGPHSYWAVEKIIQLAITCTEDHHQYLAAIAILVGPTFAVCETSGVTSFQSRELMMTLQICIDKYESGEDSTMTYREKEEVGPRFPKGDSDVSYSEGESEGGARKKSEGAECKGEGGSESTRLFQKNYCETVCRHRGRHTDLRQRLTWTHAAMLADKRFPYHWQNDGPYGSRLREELFKKAPNITG